MSNDEMFSDAFRRRAAQMGMKVSVEEEGGATREIKPLPENPNDPYEVYTSGLIMPKPVGPFGSDGG